MEDCYLQTDRIFIYLKRNLQQEDQLMKINTNRFQSSALNCAMDLCKRIRDYGHEAYGSVILYSGYIFRR